VSQASVPVSVDEPGLVAHARRLAACLPTAACVHLVGDLGAGKTTFVRALLQAWVPGLRVKSPTYALVERYRIDDREVLHADLYRVNDPEELEMLGLREAAGSALILIEWPDRGGDQVPPADLVVRLDPDGERRRLQYAVHAKVPAWLLPIWVAGPDLT
jgi:tRNA threonylcarbamoyladenosine biosynthesis protein TsaE